MTLIHIPRQCFHPASSSLKRFTTLGNRSEFASHHHRLSPETTRRQHLFFSTSKQSPSKRTAKSPSPSSPRIGFATTYVHPLSQLVLQHLQHYYHSWITANDLDHLVVHPDGTFVLGHEGLRVWTYFDKTELEHWLGVLVVKSGAAAEQTGYLLQTNHPGRRHRFKAASSTPDRVKESVQQLVKSVEEMKKSSS